MNTGVSTDYCTDNDWCIHIGGVIICCGISFLLGHWNGVRRRQRQQQQDDWILKNTKDCHNDTNYSLANNHISNNNSINTGNKTQSATITQNNNISNNNKDNAGLEILESVLQMIQDHWRTIDPNDNDADPQPVVRYKTPEDLWKTLFVKQQLSVVAPKNQEPLNINHKHETTTTPDPPQFLQMLQAIQYHSVNTNHKYFFNQLFGSLDPVSLAAELFSTACCHTSSYTYETAPVLTLLEQDIVQEMRNIVFGSTTKDNGGENENDGNAQTSTATKLQHDNKKNNNNNNVPGDGLFCPGGSFSNLLAMHAARQLYNVNNNIDSTSSSSASASSKGVSHQRDNKDEIIIIEEEKKSETLVESLLNTTTHDSRRRTRTRQQPKQKRPVALVSSEAHYSFEKAASITGIELLTLPTTRNGQLDLQVLEQILLKSSNDGSVDDSDSDDAVKRIPFFIGLTAGSTVRGSFDPIQKVVQLCQHYSSTANIQNKIWIHVDGAWGGSAIFSNHTQHLFQGLNEVDSFTFNPHKMLGAPQQTTMFLTKHKGVLKMANATGATYLFDDRKNGASYDLGDSTFTCGRRPDALKFWAMYKFYGKQGLGARVDEKVQILKVFVERIRFSQNAFMLACDPWPFNVNFYYLPPRLRHRMLEWKKTKQEQQQQSPKMKQGTNTTTTTENTVVDDPYHIPDEISLELSQVSVALKLRLHEAGEMILPYQPLTTQTADCFRLVLAGKKDFNESDIDRMMDLMDQYGRDL